MRASNWVSKKIFFITMKLNVWGLVVGGLWGWVDTLNIQKNTSCYSVIVNITQRYHQLAASWLYQQRPTSVKVVCKRPKLCGTFNMHWTHLLNTWPIVAAIEWNFSVCFFLSLQKQLWLACFKTLYGALGLRNCQGDKIPFLQRNHLEKNQFTFPSTECAWVCVTRSFGTK